MEHPLRSFHKVSRPRTRNHHERLRIDIGKWKPRALDLHHNTVSAQERMVDVRHCIVDRSCFIRLQCLRVGKGVPEARPHRFAANKLLIPRRHPMAVVFIDQLHHKVGVRAGARNLQPHGQGTSNGHILIQHIGLIRQHIRTACREPLIAIHILRGDFSRRVLHIRDGICRITDVLIVRTLLYGRRLKAQPSVCVEI